MARSANGEGKPWYSSYEGKYVGEFGGKKVRSFKCKEGDRAGRLNCQEKLALLKENLACMERGGTQTFYAFTKHWIEHDDDLRGNGEEHYLSTLKHFGAPGRMKLIDLKPLDIKTHLDGLKDEFAKHPEKYKDDGQRTRRAVWSLMHNSLNRAMGLGMVKFNAAARQFFKPPKMPERVSPDVTPRDLLFIFDELEKYPRRKAYPILSLASTLGGAELLGLHKPNVDLERAWLRADQDCVSHARSGHRPVLEPTKNVHRDRGLDLPAYAVDALRDHFALLDKDGVRSLLVFPSERKNALMRLVTMRKWWKEKVIPAAAAAAEKAIWATGETEYRFPRNIRLHDLRHISATLHRICGVEMAILRDRMGHSQEYMTEKYGKLYEPSFKAAVARLDGLFDMMRPIPTIIPTRTRLAHLDEHLKRLAA